MSIFTKKNKTRHKTQKISGFTLVETLVAISILSLAILGTFTAIQSALQQSGFAKDQITAFYLAQEAVEYVRNIRDTNALKNLAVPDSATWLQGFADTGDPCSSGQACEIDSAHTSVATCSGGGASGCDLLTQDSTTGVFGYGYNTPTRFKRVVRFTPTAGSPVHEGVVSVTMSWTSGTFAKSFTVTESLFDWH